MTKEWELLKQLETLRRKWLEAKKKNDLVMMGLWEKLGKKIKALVELKKNE